jgi:hypothetical protein
VLHFLRSILHLIPFELRFGRNPSISHPRPFGCKCFVLKRGNLDKFESHSFDDILLGYTAHDRSYQVYNFETNTVIESYDVTFDETAPCRRDVFECIQVKQGTFVHQAMYTKNLMKKFNMTELNPMSTPMSTATSLGPGEDGESVD